MINDALWDAFNQYHMGVTAENIAEQWGLTREMQDEFALNSQLKAEKAIKEGKFEEEIEESATTPTTWLSPSRETSSARL